MKLNFLDRLLGRRNQKVIVVLGMHRSGTSCLIGSLQKAGLYLGKHNTWNRFNSKGNRENNDIVTFHDQLLSDNGGSWKNPPSEVVWSKNHIKTAKRIIASYERHPIWGFKDPRTLLTFDGWKMLIPNIQPIGIFRDPAAVVQSLFNRSKDIKIETEKGFDLWFHYNEMLLEQYKKRAFPIFSFDWEPESFHKKLNDLSLKLKLERIDPQDSFFTPDLLHHVQKTNDQIPERCRQLYQELQSVCL